MEIIFSPSKQITTFFEFRGKTMTTIWNAPKLLYRTAMLKLSNVKSDQTADYNVAAASYDDYYSKYLGKCALELWDKLPVTKGQYILDLACGTGFFTEKLAEKVGQNGEIVAVDLSIGMLERNKEKAAEQNLSNISFVHSDAISYLSNVADKSVDGVVCGWGICYMDHVQLLRELERVVKPGGFIGLIENKASSLKDVSDIFTKVLMDYPEAMVKDVVLHLPKNKDYLVKTFCRGEFKSEYAWDGEGIVPCKTGEDVAEYMLKSGASAGFLNALEKTKVTQVFETFITYVDQRLAAGKKVEVKHEFCAVIGVKA